MGEPISPTVPLSAADAMQHASDLLFRGVDPITGFPALEAVRAAQAFVTMARELRLGKHGKANGRSYEQVTRSTEVTNEVVSFSWRQTPGAIGYDVHLAPPHAGGVTVTPIFGPDNAEDDLSESDV